MKFTTHSLVAIETFTSHDKDGEPIDGIRGISYVYGPHHPMLQSPDIARRFARTDSTAGRNAIANPDRATYEIGLARTMGPRKPPKRSQAGPLVPELTRSKTPSGTGSSWVLPAGTKVIDHAAERNRENRVILRTSAAKPVEVTLGSSALRAIYDEVYAWADQIERDQIETGGGLYAPPIASWNRTAHVSVADVAGGSSVRGVQQMKVDHNEFTEVERRMIEQHDTHLRYVGSWHVHPTDGPRGHVGEPSGRDMSVWLGELEFLNKRVRNTTRYLGVIATEGRLGWKGRPDLHAWIVSEDDLGRAICEPATIGDLRV